MDNLNYSPESLKDQKKKYYASFLWKLTVAFVIIFAAQIIIYVPVDLIFGVLSGLSESLSGSAGEFFANLEKNGVFTTLDAVFHLFALLVTDSFGALFLFFMTRKTSKVPEKRNLHFLYWLVLFIICFAIGGVGTIIGSLVNAFALLPSTVANVLIKMSLTGDINNINQTLAYGDDSWLYIFVNILMAGLAIPVVEELIFRKFVIDNTSKYGFGAAVMISGFTFAIFHGNFLQLFYTLGIGLLFAYVYAFTGKLRYTVLMHMGYNLYSALFPIGHKIMPQGSVEDITNAIEKLSQAAAENPQGIDAAYNWLLWVFRRNMTEPGFVIGLLFIAVTRILLLILIIAGIILFIVFLKKGINVRKQMPMGQKGTKRCAAGNYGAVLFYILGGGVFVLYYFVANLGSIASLFR